MDCVGLRPGFSLVEKAIVLYWDRSERAHAVEFVRDVLRRGSVGAGADYDGETSDGQGGVQIPPSPRNPIPLSPKHAKFMTSLAQILSLGFVARNRLPASSVLQRRALPRIPRHGLPAGPVLHRLGGDPPLDWSAADYVPLMGASCINHRRRCSRWM